MKSASLETPLGILLMEADEIGICQIRYTDERLEHREAPTAVLKEGIGQLKAYFNGDLKNFDVPLHPRGSVFQRKVWSV